MQGSWVGRRKVDERVRANLVVRKSYASGISYGDRFEPGPIFRSCGGNLPKRLRTFRIQQSRPGLTYVQSSRWRPGEHDDQSTVVAP
jgi:hypothetical protein